MTPPLLGRFQRTNDGSYVGYVKTSKEHIWCRLLTMVPSSDFLKLVPDDTRASSPPAACFFAWKASTHGEWFFFVRSTLVARLIPNFSYLPGWYLTYIEDGFPEDWYSHSAVDVCSLVEGRQFLETWAHASMVERFLSDEPTL